MSFARSKLLHLLIRAYRPLYQRGLLVDGAWPASLRRTAAPRDAARKTRVSVNAKTERIAAIVHHP